MANIHISALESDHIPYPGLEGTTYSEIFDRYASSDIGRHHATQVPRFSGEYAYDPSTMLADLGDDVHPVEHGRYTHDEILVPLLEFERRFNPDRFKTLSDGGIVALRLVAHIHDFGESEHEQIKQTVGETVGDQVYYDKTEQHAATEARIREFLRSLFFVDIPKELWDQTEAIISGQDTEQTADIFSLVEHLGYYLTGLRAGYLAVREIRHRQAGSPQRDDVSFEKLRELGMQVTEYHRVNTIPERRHASSYADFILQRTVTLYEVIQTEL